MECALRASKLEDIVEKNLLSCFSYSTADFRPGIVPRHIKIQLRQKNPTSCLHKYQTPGSLLGPSWVPPGSLLGPSWVPLGSLLGPSLVPFSNSLVPVLYLLRSILSLSLASLSSLKGPISDLDLGICIKPTENYV